MATNGAAPEDPTWKRLTEQLDWYDRNATKNQQWFKVIKLSQIVLSALVPVVAAANGDRVILGALGAGVVVLEAVQQLYQFHRNWISYRSTAEALKREQHLYEVGAGEYAAAAQPKMLLAERLEQLISRETGDWASLETASQKKPT